MSENIQTEPVGQRLAEAYAAYFIMLGAASIEHLDVNNFFEWCKKSRLIGAIETYPSLEGLVARAWSIINSEEELVYVYELDRGEISSVSEIRSYTEHDARLKNADFLHEKLFVNKPDAEKLAFEHYKLVFVRPLKEETEEG